VPSGAVPPSWVANDVRAVATATDERIDAAVERLHAAR
jgi:hypothetical protein